jgi:dynein assembly factor 1
MLPKLNSLYLSHNKLQTVEDIEHLKECKNLSVVDLSHNCIEDPDAVQVFSQMENIVNYLNNFCCDMLVSLFSVLSILWVIHY